MGVSAAETAASVLRKCAAKIDAQTSVVASFVISGQDGPVNGEITLAKAAFAMSTPQIKVWYDGRTQWTYLSASGEVSITEPTAAELMESNPFTIFTNFESHYKTRLVKAPAGSKAVELTPLSGSALGIRRAVVTINSATGYPAAVSVTFTNGQEIKAQISKIAPGKKLPASYFRFDNKKYPAAEIIDLR